MALSVGAAYELTDYRQGPGGLAYHCLSCSRLFPLRLAGGDPYAFDERWLHEEGCPTGNAERERRSAEYLLMAQSPVEGKAERERRFLAELLDPLIGQRRRVTLPVELL